MTDDQPHAGVHELLAHDQNIARSVEEPKTGKRQLAPHSGMGSGDQVLALIQQQQQQQPQHHSAHSNTPDTVATTSGGKRHFTGHGSSAASAATVNGEAPKGPERKHFALDGTTLEAGIGGLSSAKQTVSKPSIGLVPHTKSQAALIAHNIEPTDLSGATKPTKRVFEGLSGGAETIEPVKSEPKRSKLRRDTTAGAIIYQKGTRSKEEHKNTLKLVEGVRNKRDHLSNNTSIADQAKASTRRHFPKELNKDQVTAIFENATPAGVSSLDAHKTKASTVATTAKVAAMSGSAAQSCLSWDK